jgi:hypothetical protein
LPGKKLIGDELNSNTAKNRAAILAEFSDSACTNLRVENTAVKRNRFRIDKMGELKNIKDTFILMI